ncbi:MAG: hypothetical protein WAU24_00025 [Chitinophagaceae bacterium]
MQKQKLKIEYVNIKMTVEDVQPPPFNIKTTFKTVEEWLFNICDSEKPQKPVTNYSIGIFESRNDYTLSFVGLYVNQRKTEIAYEPLNMYFLLPKTEYKDLSREQLADKLVIQLKKFTATKKFMSSFLVQADSIFLNGTTKIWSK